MNKTTAQGRLPATGGGWEWMTIMMARLTSVVATVVAVTILATGCMNIPGKLKEANAAAANGNWQLASDITEKVLRKDKTNLTARILHGICLQEMQRGDEALASLEQAATLAPDNFTAQYFYGWALAENGRFADALVPLRRAYDLRKDNQDLLILLARCSLEQNLPEGARYLQCLQRYPTLEAKPELYNALGVLWVNQGQYELAKRNFTKAWQRLPQSTVAPQNLAVLYDQYLRNPTEALKHYRFCLAECEKTGDSLQGAKIRDRILQLARELPKTAAAVPPAAAAGGKKAAVGKPGEKAVKAAATGKTGGKPAKAAAGKTGAKGAKPAPAAKKTVS